jgi:hypothetical protein
VDISIMLLKEWPPRNILQIIALCASIVGRIALFSMSIWLAWVIWQGGWETGLAQARLDWLGWSLIIVLVGGMLRDLADGALLTPRRGKVTKDGVEYSAGNDSVVQEEINQSITTATTKL